MGTARNIRRLAWACLTLVPLPLAAVALQAGDTAVEVPSAAVAYSVPGVWEKREPHEAQSVCSPSLHRADDLESIDVEVFPNDAGKTYDMAALKAVADAYAGTMQEIKGAAECEVAAFDSEHHVKGYRIHYVSTPTHFTGGSKTYQNSIYLFANGSEHMVFVTYTAETSRFNAETDASIQRTITLADH